MDTPTVSESRDGVGCGDHNVEFAWGTPASYLTTMQQARLLIMRGYVRDFRHGERGGAADGDLAYTELTETGLSIPITPAAPVPDEYRYDG
jgi:hypothetical protein